MGVLGAAAVMFFGAAPGASANPAFGLNWISVQQARTVEEMDAVQHAGATLFRLEIQWDKRPAPEWGDLDQIFDHAAERGITILPYFYGPAKPYPTEPEYPAWEEWVRTVVRRYGVGGSFWAGKAYARPVTAWEAWNEPNLTENSPGGVVNPTLYGRFLAHTAAAIRSVPAGTGAQVLFGGLYSPAHNVSEFLQGATAAAGGPSAYNGLGLHPYGFAGSVKAESKPGTDVVAGNLAAVEENVEEARHALNQFGGFEKTLWITELGWPVEFGVPGVQPQVTEAQQRELLTRSFNWIRGKAADFSIASLVWFSGRDGGNSVWFNRCGLIELGGGVRPAWWAYLEQTGAPRWSPTGAWFSDNLGGEFTSNADISSSEPNRLDLFSRGTDSALWHRWFFPGPGWSAWERVGGSLASGPGAVSWGPGRIDVVAAAGNGSVSHFWWQDGSGWNSDNLGGTVGSVAGTSTDPDISSSEPNRLDVFIKGTDNALWHRWFFPGPGWSAWERVGGSLASGPGAVSWGPGRIDVVARAADNSVVHFWWQDGSGWNSDNLGGSISSGPDIASPEPGRLDVFAKGKENGLWHRKFVQGSGWSAWERVGEAIATGPGAVSWGPNRLDVVAESPAGGLTHTWWQGN